MIEPKVHTCFEPVTGTWQYIVADQSDPSGPAHAAIIDSVMDYDPSTDSRTTISADALLGVVREEGYVVDYILETHAHADHLTASQYLKEQLQKMANSKPQVCIGSRITIVQDTFAPRYGLDSSKMREAFDHTFADDEIFSIGSLQAKVLHLPGHTPDHVGYVIGSNIFTGDSIFNPDVGSARCDFPGGSAEALFRSMTKLLELPEHWKLYTGHDYPPQDREGGAVPVPYTTVGAQRRSNKHVKVGTREEEFVQWRKDRDATLKEPRLLQQSMRWNIQAGWL